MRLVFIGFLSGAAAAAGLGAAFWHAPRSAAEEAAGLAGAVAPAYGGDEALRRELESLRAGNALLRAKIASTAPVEPARPASGHPRLNVRDMGKLMWKYHSRVPGGALPEDDFNAIKLAMKALLAKVMAATGVRLDEADSGPDGKFAVLLAILDACEPPLDAEQRATVERAAAEFRRGWEEYLGKREGLTRLEQALELARLNERVRPEVDGCLSKEQRDAVAPLEARIPWMASTAGASGVRTGDREAVEDQLTDAWTSELGLDSTLAPVVHTIVQDYMRDVDAAEAAGKPKTPHWEDEAWMIEIAARAQKKLADSLGLKGEDAKRLREWSTIYGFKVVEEK